MVELLVIWLVLLLELLLGLLVGALVGLLVGWNAGSDVGDIVVTDWAGSDAGSLHIKNKIYPFKNRNKNTQTF